MVSILLVKQDEPLVKAKSRRAKTPTTAILARMRRAIFVYPTFNSCPARSAHPSYVKRVRFLFSLLQEGTSRVVVPKVRQNHIYSDLLFEAFTT